MKKLLIAIFLLLPALGFTQQYSPARLNIATGAVSVPQAGNTTLTTINTTGVKRIFVKCSVVGQNLDAFIIAGKSAADTTFSTFYSVSGDYTSPTGILIGTSGDLTTQAAGTSGWFILDASGIDQIRVSASSGNVAGSTVSCWINGGAY